MNQREKISYFKLLPRRTYDYNVSKTIVSTSKYYLITKFDTYNLRSNSTDASVAYDMNIRHSDQVK